LGQLAFESLYHDRHQICEDQLMNDAREIYSAHPLFRELRNGLLWHCTSPEEYLQIRTCGFIKPNERPDGKYGRLPSACQALDGVSLFDFTTESVARVLDTPDKAANQGDAQAQYNLGYFYGEGEGVTQNELEAYIWSSLAAAQGDTKAEHNRDLAASRMSREEIIEGQRCAAAFVPRIETPGSSSDNSTSSTNPSFTGTGFFITDDGYLITNYHVVKDATQIRLVTSAGLIAAKVISVDAANDLALLKADGRFTPLPISPSRSAQLGSTVATIGFPDPGLQGFAPKLAKGEIASLSGAADDPRYFQISVPVQPGNSGGALVDERGNVVGIVSAKLDESAALAASGALPENVNYAVKSSLLLSFLESVPDVDAKLKAPNTADEKFEDVVKSAQQAAVLVLVY
jgi:S1-C subfamily serine protease